MDELIAVGPGRRGRGRGGPRRDERARVTARPPGGGSRPDGLPGQRRVRRPEPARARRARRRRPRRRRHRAAEAGRSRGLHARRRSPRPRRRRRRPVLTPPRLRHPDAVAAILALEPALVVLADYGQIVPPALLDLPHGALNLHPSLLPRHRGASPIPAAILAGDRETGVTLMRMDAGLDTGPIVAASVVPLDRDRDGARARGAPRRPRRRPARPVAGAVARAATLPATPAARGRRDADPAAAPRGRPARPVAAGGRARAARPRLPAVARDVPRGRTASASSSAPRPSRASRPDDVPGAPRAATATCRRSRRPTDASCSTRVTPPGRKPMSGADCLRGRRRPSA